MPFNLSSWCDDIDLILWFHPFKLNFLNICLKCIVNMHGALGAMNLSLTSWVLIKSMGNTRIYRHSYAAKLFDVFANPNDLKFDSA